MKIATLAISLILSSCAMPNGSQSTGETQLLSAAAVVSSNDTNAVRSEKLAKIADTLFSAGAPKQAMDVADVALEIDPSNVRAGLIRSVAKPLFLLRGFMNRFVDYAQTWPSSYLGPAGQLRAMQLTRKNDPPQPSFEDFLWEVVPEKDYPAYKSEKSIQDEIDDVIASFDDLRRFTKANRESKIAISAASTMLPVLIDRYANACHVVEDSALTYRLDCPADHDVTTVMFDRADFEMLTDVASYYEFSLTLANAYDLSGLAQAYNPELSQPTPQLIKTLIDGHSTFGKLRATARIQDLKDLTLDIVNGMNWAIANQRVICFQNDAGRMNHIFDSGLCVGGDMSSVMTPATDLANGKTVQVQTASGGTTDFNAMAFLQKPIADLRSLAPFALDSNGQIIGISDQSLGGTFPKRDFNSVLRAP